MSVAVFRLDQLPCPEISPAHNSSRQLALLLVTAKVAKWVCEKRKAIQLLVKESWASIKQRFRMPEPMMKVTVVKRHVLNAPGYHVPNMLAYPPNGYESNAKQLQAEVWLKAERF